MCKLTIAAAPILATLTLLVLASCHPQSALPSPSQTTNSQQLTPLGIGRDATELEIALWDIDVRPDGTGLPPGRGTVASGQEIYSQECASCHGPTGVEGPNTRLAGRIEGDSFPFGEDLEAVETVGNYWPYATTIFDYVQRAMPYDAPGSLTPEQVYSVTAFLLYLNEIVPDNVALDSESLPAIRMPARDRFVEDDRKGGPEVR